MISDPFGTHVRFARAPDLEAWAATDPPLLAAARTRLPTRLLEEVWFPTHACQRLLASLFASLFAGKREATPM